MHQPFFIRKVAVLGAGVMGAQIAAHCVNAGIETLLFDLPSPEGPANGIVDKAIANLGKLKPAPFATPSTGSHIQARNYKDNLGDLRACDLVIEAIAERLDWKEDLYKKISPYLAPHAILASNTSGLSINSLSQVLPKEHRHNFCGIHFFNPPRYMHLAEIIPASETNPQLLDNLETWLTSHLGKGVIRAKDTPNFIANRIGVFSMLSVLHHTQAFGLGLDEVDALTGPLLGRPKSATYRTMDVVGLDTMQHVIHTMNEQLTDDPWHAIFKLPEWLHQLVKQGALGQKSGQGLYKKNGKVIEVFNVQTGQYVPSTAKVSDDVLAIMKMANPEQRMQALIKSDNKQAQFLTACFRDLFHYCAYHLPHIANTVRDVDLAIRWGFGWEQGPFETWQLSNISDMVNYIEKAIADKQTLANVSLPDWTVILKEFYNDSGAYSPGSKSYIASSHLPVYKKQIFPAKILGQKTLQLKTMYENPGVKLWNLTDEVAVVSFKSKANTIGQEVLDGLHNALDMAEQQCKGLIVYQQDAGNFSSGADLRGVAGLIQANKFSALDDMIAQFQHTAMRLKYSSIPTVAALRGRALGGGCELMMHCSAVVAAFESYPGLVEAGVGVIPAGGGSKEMALRASRHAEHGELMDFLEPYFKQIATAQVAGSASEAIKMGYVRRKDSILMHADEVLNTALAKVQYMTTANYQPPLSSRFKVAGREGKARIETGLVNWLEGGFISKHDFFLANQLAEVMTGGNVNEGELVDELWMLKLERIAFLTLAETPETQARIQSLLETGKPLRN